MIINFINKFTGNDTIPHLHKYPISGHINRYGVPPIFIELKNPFIKVQRTVLFSRLFKRIINITVLRTLNLLIINGLINIFGAQHLKIEPQNKYKIFLHTAPPID